MRVVVNYRRCAVCGLLFRGPGNNAAPLSEGRCCDACNRQRVVPARMLAIIGWDQNSF